MTQMYSLILPVTTLLCGTAIICTWINNYFRYQPVKMEVIEYVDDGQ